MCACLVGCGQKPPVATRDETMPKKLLVSDVTEFPVATDELTYEQRRQLVLDFFELQLTFQWVPNMDITDWQSTNWQKGTYKELLTTEVYGGIPYQSYGFGNLYRWLEYYDEHTGVMDLETAFAENGGYGEGAAMEAVETDADGNITFKKYRSFQALFNQCQSGAGWSWARLLNSAKTGMLSDYNMYNGFIPVGCYSYGFEHEGKQYGPMDIQLLGLKRPERGNPIGYSAANVIRDWNAANGMDAMFNCYAQMKPGDILISGGHAMMVKSVEIVTWPNGSINQTESKAYMLEQWEAWGQVGKLGDKTHKIQGGVNNDYTFQQLQDKNYLPFTYVEVLDPNDPQDKKHLDYYETYKDQVGGIKDLYSAIPYSEEMGGAGIEKAQVYSTLDKTEGSISYAEFAGMSVAANYSVSDVFVTVTDKDGKELLKNIYRADICAVREVPMTAGLTTWETDEAGNRLDLTSGVKELANGENTISITLQVGTGEVLTAFNGTLTE